MVKLTDYEKSMLEGEMGEFKQVAIKHIVEYAEALGATELCEVSRGTLFLGAHNYLEAAHSEDYEEIFSKMYMCSDKKLKLDNFADDCFTQTCATPGDYFIYEPLNMSKESFDKNREYLEQTREVGVSIAGTCTPYLTGWIPLKGEHYVTTESHNVLMCNSVFGACGNSDGIEAAAWSTVCGRTPLWGNHIMENRKGTHVFNIECKSKTSVDWDIIGYTVGKKLPPHGIPVLAGNFEAPTLIKLKQCFAAMATTSGAEMCHIVGITPEARTIEDALGGKAPIDTIVISQEDYDESFSELSDAEGGAVDFVSLGCPHYTLEEIKTVVDYLKGKKIADGVKFFVWTDIATKGAADVNKYTDIIEEAGGYLVTSGCPLNAGKACHGTMKGMAFDGAKQAHYIRSESDARIYYGDIHKCIDAAVKGKWEA